MQWMSYVPKSYLSWIIGKIANLPVPWPLNVISIHIFAKCYGIDPASAERPVSAYRSVGDFFTRNLRPELRPIEDGLISPVDGRLRSFESVPESGALTQCKGKMYTTSELLGDADLAQCFIGGSCFNFYLSPTDAHHIFSPCDGTIIETIHIPGKLWPVNNWALRSVDGLFVVNERVISILETQEERIAVVMVGATNVGRIQTHYADIVTNAAPWRVKQRMHIKHHPGIAVSRGMKIGTFHMGSSVIVLTQKPRRQSKIFEVDQVVRYGEGLCV